MKIILETLAISAGLILLFFLYGFLMCYWHGNVSLVRMTAINDKVVSFNFPVKIIPGKEKLKGSELYQYRIRVRYYQGGWFLHHIPKEKRTYLTCSYMGMSAAFILHYAITDPKMEKALLDELKQIKPYKIIK